MVQVHPQSERRGVVKPENEAGSDAERYDWEARFRRAAPRPDAEQVQQKVRRSEYEDMVLMYADVPTLLMVADIVCEEDGYTYKDFDGWVDTLAGLLELDVYVARDWEAR